MNKRLIALLVAILSSSTLTMTGCGEQQENKNDYKLTVIDFNGVATLHKDNSPVGLRDSKFTSYEFKCGEKLYSNCDAIRSSEGIDPKYYNEVCPECFSEEEIKELSK